MPYTMPFREIRQALLDFITKWPEVYTVGLAIGAWYWSTKIIRWVAPDAPAWDISELQRIIFAVTTVACLSGAVFIGIKLNFPRWDEYYDNVLGDDIKKLTPWQRVVMFTFLYLSLLLFLVLLVSILS